MRAKAAIGIIRWNRGCIKGRPETDESGNQSGTAYIAQLLQILHQSRYVRGFRDSEIVDN
jgi:hypothetical protein